MTRRLVVREGGMDHICGIFAEGEPVPDSFGADGKLFRLFACTERYAHYEHQGPLPIPESWEHFVNGPATTPRTDA